MNIETTLLSLRGKTLTSEEFEILENLYLIQKSSRQAQEQTLKKVLTVFSLIEGVEKEINLVFRSQERAGRLVWCCDLENDTISDLEELMSVKPD